MKQQQAFVALQSSKNVHFGEPCESGYSTTTSSEEGTLQRGVSHARKQGFASESFFQNPKLLEMVAQGNTHQDKKREKIIYHETSGTPSSQGSPYSSTSSLTQQYVPQNESAEYSINGLSARYQQKKTTSARSNEKLADRSSTDDLASSFEDLDIRGDKNYDATDDDVIKSAAIKQFHQSMNQVRSGQTEKFSYPHFAKGKSHFDVDYYKVRSDPQNLYYDPMDISGVAHGQSKKRVVISVSPSSSSGTGSPVKHSSPMRGILKSTKSAKRPVSPSSTPTRKNSLQMSQQFSKSEENLTSIKNITPPNLTSPISPGNRKSAFQIVKPRARNHPAFSECPVMPIHPPVQQMVEQNGLDPHYGLYPHTCSHGLTDETLQCQVTPRNSIQVPRPATLEYTAIADQLRSPQNSKASSVDGNIIFIPAQIDENGIARPVVSGFHDNINKFQASSRSHESRHLSDNRSEPHVVNCDKIHHHGNCGHDHSNHDDSIRSESPLPPAEILSNEAVRLRQFLEKSSPEDLKLRLEKLLKTKDPASIHAMTTLFPGSEFTADAAHCVRCHKDFNPREPGRCILPHPDRMVAKISQDAIGADFVCGCCNAGFRLIKMDFYEESTNALLTGHCYSGTHTTDPESVDYRIDGGAAKSCEEFGCIEFYV